MKNSFKMEILKWILMAYHGQTPKCRTISLTVGSTYLFPAKDG